MIRGVSYALPEAPCLWARDLPLIAAMGANTVRTTTLLPEGDKTFLALLDSAGLYWLAGFPLEPYYDPAQTLAAQKPRILHALRKYAWRLRGQPRVLALVFGRDVARDYGRKFAGSPQDFYQLIGEAAAMLREVDPQDPPLLTTSVTALDETARRVPGLSFWSLDAYPGAAAVAAARKLASAPLLISAFAGQTARETATAIAAIESAGLFGEVYAAYTGADGIFEATPTEHPGIDTLRASEVYYALAGLWRGSYPAPWAEKRKPRLTGLDDGAPNPETTSPGALVRLAGAALLHSTPAYADDRWPMHLAMSCLCVGGLPARLNMVNAAEVSAQIPPAVEPGELTAVFFRAGVASNFLPIRVRQFSAETRSGPVLEARGRSRQEPGVWTFRGAGPRPAAASQAALPRRISVAFRLPASWRLGY